MKEHRQNDTFITSAEYQVLSLIIQNPGMDLELRRADFPHARAQTIFKAILVLRESEEEINFGSLLREANRIDSSIDASYISAILAFEVTEKNFQKAVEILQKASLKYKAMLVLDTLSSKLESFDELNADTVSEYLYKVQNVFDRGRKPFTLRSVEELLLEYVQELRDRKAGKIYPLNDYFLDTTLVRKGAPGQIILLAGTTGTGKSIVGLNLVNGFIEAEIPSIYLSLEMDAISTAERLACLRNGIPVESWYERDMIDSLVDIILKDIERIRGRVFGFDDDPSYSVEKVRAVIRQFKKKHGVKYLVCVVDLITQVKNFVNLGRNSTLATAIELAVNRLNEVAKQEGVCIIAIAQMGRNKFNPKVNSIEEIPELRPTLEQIKNSNALGERSRVVISVFRPKYHALQLFPNDEELEYMDDILELQVLKQNMGRTGSIGHYLFDGATSTLRPAPQETEVSNE